MIEQRPAGDTNNINNCYLKLFRHYVSLYLSLLLHLELWVRLHINLDIPLLQRLNQIHDGSSRTVIAVSRGNATNVLQLPRRRWFETKMAARVKQQEWKLLIYVAAKAVLLMARSRGSEDAAQGNLRGASASACCLSNFYSPVGLLDTSLATAAVI